MNSVISDTPGPEVAVKARAPFHPAPTTMPMEAISSSACTMANLFMPVDGSTRSLLQYFWNASATEDDGVIGYQAATVAPPYTQPRAAALLPPGRCQLAACLPPRQPRGWPGTGRTNCPRRARRRCGG